MRAKYKLPREHLEPNVDSDIEVVDLPSWDTVSTQGFSTS